MYRFIPVKQFDYVNVYGMDVTLEKEILEDLRESNEIYKKMFNITDQGILGIEPETGNILMANNAFCNLLGYKENEIIKLNLEDIRLKESPNPNLFNKQKDRKNNFASSNAFLTKNKKIKYFNVDASVISVSRKKILLCFFREIQR